MSHETRGVIIGYLAREQQLRIEARQAMVDAEAAYKIAADQYGLSSNIIADLLDDLVDVQDVPPPPQGFQEYES